MAGGPCIEAEGIGHPLIPEDRVVRNDVRIGGKLQVLVVSGSNMSGKSTLLRTLGVNAVLAQAGAPVRARRLRLSPLAVGASIRVTDSLQGGVSRFYAEILRLRQILDLTAGPLPVLFLIDEFLHGTNSHDRRIGAEALVRGLVERGAMGLITTHDLALADIADVLGERAANVHFEDQIEDGQIRFDYDHAAGRGAEEQRDRADAVGGAGDLTGGRYPARWRARAASSWRAWRAAEPAEDRARYHEWVAAGYAGEMRYLTDRRAGSARRSAQSAALGAVGRSAWASCITRRGRTPRVPRCGARLDFALRLGRRLSRRAAARPGAAGRRCCGSAPARTFESKICVDTAPLLERSYARLAGLGWIGRNTCLINQQSGLVVFPGRAAGVARARAGRAAARPLRHLHAAASTPAPRRRSCRGAAVATLDSRLCISYFTIELRGAIPEEQRAGDRRPRLRLRHLPGCLPVEPARAGDGRSGVRSRAISRRRWSSWRRSTEEEFRALFRGTPVTRARYAGFLRNVAIAMGNAGLPQVPRAAREAGGLATTPWWRSTPAGRLERLLNRAAEAAKSALSPTAAVL